MQQPRAHERSKVALAGYLILDEDADEEIGCEIADLSPGGAKVKVGMRFKIGTAMQLKIGTLGPYPVTVRWQRLSDVGLRFELDEETMAEVIMAVATYG